MTGIVIVVSAAFIFLLSFVKSKYVFVLVNGEVLLQSIFFPLSGYQFYNNPFSVYLNCFQIHASKIVVHNKKFVSSYDGINFSRFVIG